MSTLETILTQHRDMTCDAAMHGWECHCGWGEDDYRHSEADYYAHVADAIREWLTNDEMVDRVQNYVPLGFDPQRDPYTNTHEAARAILTAALTNQGDQ